MRLNLLTKWGYFRKVEVVSLLDNCFDTKDEQLRIVCKEEETKTLGQWHVSDSYEGVQEFLKTIGDALSYVGGKPDLWEVTINTINNMITWESEDDIERITLKEIRARLGTEQKLAWVKIADDGLEEKQETVVKEETTEEEWFNQAKGIVLEKISEGRSLEASISSLEETFEIRLEENPIDLQALKEEVIKELKDMAFINYKNKMDEKLARWAKPEGE